MMENAHSENVTERGFVLPLVLIMLALLTALAMGLSRMAGVQVQQTLVKKQQFEGYVNVQNATQTALPVPFIDGATGAAHVQVG